MLFATWDYRFDFRRGDLFRSDRRASNAFPTPKPSSSSHRSSSKEQGPGGRGGGFGPFVRGVSGKVQRLRVLWSTSSRSGRRSFIAFSASPPQLPSSGRGADDLSLGLTAGNNNGGENSANSGVGAAAILFGFDPVGDAVVASQFTCRSFEGERATRCTLASGSLFES